MQIEPVMQKLWEKLLGKNLSLNCCFFPLSFCLIFLLLLIALTPHWIQISLIIHVISIKNNSIVPIFIRGNYCEAKPVPRIFSQSEVQARTAGVELKHQGKIPWNATTQRGVYSFIQGAIASWRTWKVASVCVYGDEHNARICIILLCSATATETRESTTTAGKHAHPALHCAARAIQSTFSRARIARYCKPNTN